MQERMGADGSSADVSRNSTDAPGPEAERVELHLDKREYLLHTLVSALLSWAAIWLCSLGVDVVVAPTRASEAPLDIWSFVRMPGVMLGVGLVLFAIVAISLKQPRWVSVLDAGGVHIPPRGIQRPAHAPWSTVTGVGLVRAGFTCHPALRLADGRSVMLPAPYGWRRTDPRLVRALALIQDYIQRYGGRTNDPPVRVSAARHATVGVVLLGVMMVPGLVRIVVSPILVPWGPHATALPHPCEALAKAGLDRHWPAAEREPAVADEHQVYQGAEHSCDVGAVNSLDQGPRFDRITLSITRFEGDFWETGRRRPTRTSQTMRSTPSVPRYGLISATSRTT